MDLEQLRELERLCLVGFESSNVSQSERDNALIQIEELKTNPEFIPQCQFILDNSQSPYAQFLAAQSLEALVTKFWGNFTPEQRLDMRNYLLSYMTSKYLDRNVILSLTKCCSRITKLGWFDSEEQREIVLRMQRILLDDRPEFKVVAMQLYIQLVEEMNTPTAGKTMTQHRKTAVSFRDQGLFNAFSSAILILRSMQNGSIVGDPRVLNELQKLAVELTNNCLKFDFIGTNPEESQEDVGTVQVPSAWRPIIQDTSTMIMLFTLYENSKPPVSALAIDALVHMSSVRRSLFSSDVERNAFLNTLMAGIYRIMEHNIGLDERENYHEFCRLLGRLKASYQLSELVKTPNFIPWMQMAKNFTVSSFAMWEEYMNSIQYLLALWGRMVAALPYLRDEGDPVQAEVLRMCVLEVTKRYLHTMIIESTQEVATDECEDPLEDEGTLRETMERLPVIVRLHYVEVGQYLSELFESNLSQFAQTSAAPVVQFGQYGPTSGLVEARLTWLVQIVAAVIGGAHSHDARKSATDDLYIDARLSAYCFSLIDAVNKRLIATNGAGKVNSKLEDALLEFFRSFKKMYLVDEMSSNGRLLSTASGLDTSPLVIVYQPPSSISAPSGELQFAMEDKAESRGTIFDIMGQGLSDSTMVMSLFIDKICSNIKYWNTSENILEETLAVFSELIASYGSSKMLLSLDSVRFLVFNHTGTNFPFLGYGDDNKLRIQFYAAMSRLVFSSSEDVDNLFDAFIEPNLLFIQALSKSDLGASGVRMAIIGLLRDLRGIASSTYNKRTYLLLFESLFPEAIPLLNNIAIMFSEDPVVMTALLKFMQEFVQNRGQRIQFDQSSAHGILLFRETSKILCAYGSRILQTPHQRDVYIEKYKGIRLMLNTLACALSGNYVNFGVFALYQDPALQDALDVSLQIVTIIPLEHVMQYPKLGKAFYGCLEVFFRNHLEVLALLDSKVFLQLVMANHDGLQNSDPTIVSQCASSIDHLATYIFLNMTRPKETVQRVMMHMQSDPDCFFHLMNTLFTSLLFAGGSTNHWPLTRPLLSLILISDAAYIAYRSHLSSSQSPENQAKLDIEFTRLTENLGRSLEVTNRDKFTQRVTIFRANVRAFMNL
jgi:exportin-7